MLENKQVIQSSRKAKPWDFAELCNKGYRVGSIIRVCMKNFITYDDCEVFPGPKLNVIIGPNGTGKSTMTHAICLACGGSPSSVGRSDDLRQFVKRGKETEESFCEVDILHHDSVVTVRRIINAENKGSKWMLSNKPTSQAQIKELMKSLNIDVDNLCSFMPQDKVGNFTQLTSEGILQKTLECIKFDNNSTLYDEQVAISNIQAETQDAERDVELQQQRVDCLTRLISGMKAEVERIRQRACMQNKVKLYEIKIGVANLKERTDAFKRSQAHVDEINLTYANRRDTLAPLEARVRSVKRTHAECEKSCKLLERSQTEVEDSLESSKSVIDDLDVQIASFKTQLDNAHTNRRQMEQKLHKLTTDENKLQSQLDDALNSMSAIEAKINRASEHLAEVGVKIDELGDNMNHLRNSLREPTELLQHYKRELDGIQDNRKLLKNRLSEIRGGKDIVNAMDWIESNRQRIRGECYGPVIAEIQVSNPIVAAMVEKFIPHQKLMYFVVSNSEDEKLLRNELRNNRKLQINISTIKHRDMIPSPYTNSIQILKNDFPGLQGLLSAQIRMPDLVRVFLNNFASIDSALWASGHNLISQIAPEKMSNLCSNTNRYFRLYVAELDQRGSVKEIIDYSGTKSRYSPNDPPSIITTAVPPARLVGLANSEETAAKQSELETAIRGANERIHHLNSEIELCRKEMDTSVDNQEKIKAELRKLRETASLPKKIQKQIETNAKAIADISKKLNVNHEEELEKMVGGMNKHMDQMFNNIAETQLLSMRCADICTSKSVCSQSVRVALTKVHNLSAELETHKQELSALEREIKAAERERDQINKSVKQAEENLMSLQESVGGQDYFDQLYLRSIQEIPDATKNELERQMNELIGQLEATVDNPELVTRYEASCAELENETAVLERKRNDLQTGISSTSERRNKWHNTVKTIADRLNLSFSAYMEELGFRGEAKLEEASSFMNFKMQMYVAFRDSQNIQKLSGQAHSGGERAVSTIMYLMSLQDLTSSPFRVVDEINQGMDERNERLVIDRIVKSCCDGTGQGHHRTAKSQYFLVSPKLLPGLRSLDNEDVTVLLVWNGPGIMSKWQLTDVIPALKKRKSDLMMNSS